MRRGLVVCLILLTLISLVSATKLEVSTTKDTFKADENITLKVTVLDDDNNPINDLLEITIENAEKTKKITKTIPSNELVDVKLEKGATHGYWNLVASYQGQNSSSIFMVELEESAKFEIKDDKLIITNTGNTKYSKTVQIIIGNTIGVRNPDLEIGGSIDYRLVAPEGNYNIKVTDGVTTLERNEVLLTGTGQAIGALDERTSERSPLTGGISPDEESDLAIMNYIKRSKFIYIFIFVILGAGILVAIMQRLGKPKKK